MNAVRVSVLERERFGVEQYPGRLLGDGGGVGKPREAVDVDGDRQALGAAFDESYVDVVVQGKAN